MIPIPKLFPSPSFNHLDTFRGSLRSSQRRQPHRILSVTRYLSGERTSLCGEQLLLALQCSPMLRTQLLADPSNRFLHDVILDSCRRHPEKLALVDASSGRRFTYAEYGDTVERLARGFVASGLRPGEVVAIFLPNSWEFAVAYHAATLAGAIPTLLNPTYREREVRYQLEASDATILITDGPLLHDINLAGLPALRHVFSIRQKAPQTILRICSVPPQLRCLSQISPRTQPSPRCRFRAAPLACPKASCSHTTIWWRTCTRFSAHMPHHSFLKM